MAGSTATTSSADGRIQPRLAFFRRYPDMIGDDGIAAGSATEDAMTYAGRSRLITQAQPRASQTPCNHQDRAVHDVWWCRLNRSPEVVAVPGALRTNGWHEPDLAVASLEPLFPGGTPGAGVEAIIIYSWQFGPSFNGLPNVLWVRGSVRQFGLPWVW